MQSKNDIKKIQAAAQIVELTAEINKLILVISKLVSDRQAHLVALNKCLEKSTDRNVCLDAISKIEKSIVKDAKQCSKLLAEKMRLLVSVRKSTKSDQKQLTYVNLLINNFDKSVIPAVSKYPINSGNICVIQELSNVYDLIQKENEQRKLRAHQEQMVQIQR